MAMSDTSSNSSNLHIYFEKKLLETAQPRLQLAKLGKKQKLPKGNGKQVKWLRYTKIGSSTSTLTEGTAPSEISFTTANVTATVAQYGQFSKVSDLLSDTAIDPVLSNLSELFGRAAAETVEDLIVAELDAQAFIQRVNDRANNNAMVAGDVLNHLEIIEAVVRMKAAYVGPHESGSYMAVIHPTCQYDLMVDDDMGAWLDVNKRGSGNDKLIRGEFGMLYGTRFLVGDKMTATNNATPISIKQNYIIGEEAYGVVELDSDSIKMIIKPADSGGVANPLNQYSTVGYKIHGFAAKYLESGSKRVTQIKATSALG